MLYWRGYIGFWMGGREVWGGLRRGFDGWLDERIKLGANAVLRVLD